MKNQVFIKEVINFPEDSDMSVSTFSAYKTLTGVLKSEGLYYLYPAIRYFLLTNKIYNHGRELIIRNVNLYH